VTNYELTISGKDGRETVVSYNATTFTGADGRLRGVFAAARDITDQKNLEEQIRQQNRELTETTAFMNNVLESSTEYSIIAKDLEGKVLAWNEGARRNYGYSADEMVGKQYSQILHTPEDVESGRVKALLDTARATGKAEGVFDRVRKNGQQFTASVAVTLRKGADGAPLGFVLISKDITGQKQLEEQLRRKNEELEEQNRRVQEANRLKSEFLANMSHELRTPLNGIIGFAEIMHDGKVGPIAEKHREYLDDILTSARHLHQLINDVLDLAKVESGKMEFRPEIVSLTRLVSEVRDVLRTLAARKQIRIETSVDESVETILIDPAKLKQVLYNYLSNALKFTPDSGGVRVCVTPEGEDWFRLEVQDTGVGIHSEDISRLFVEFQQLDASAAKKYQGTGLGLALTRRIVEAQGGTVGVRSTPAEGSAFYAVLPRTHSDSVVLPTKAPPVSMPFGKRPRILVVEDEPADQRLIMDSLTQAGYAVDAASTGAEAIQRCNEQVYDALTIDLLLPDMGGLEVLARIRAEGKSRNVVAIVVSVIADRRMAAAFLIQDFLVKPVRAEDLVEALSRAGVEAQGDRAVLFVDDDTHLPKIIEPALIELGFRPLWASDGEEGLRVFKESRPAVIVLDLLMPGMNGFEFLRRFRAIPSALHTPVIVWSVMDLSEDERGRLQAAAQAVIPKNSDTISTLITELASYMSRSPRATQELSQWPANPS